MKLNIDNNKDKEKDVVKDNKDNKDKDIKEKEKCIEAMPFTHLNNNYINVLNQN